MPSPRRPQRIPRRTHKRGLDGLGRRIVQWIPCRGCKQGKQKGTGGAAYIFRSAVLSRSQGRKERGVEEHNRYSFLMTITKANMDHWGKTYNMTFTFLANAFIQSNIQCIQVIDFLSVCVFPGT